MARLLPIAVFRPSGKRRELGRAAIDGEELDSGIGPQINIRSVSNTVCREAEDIQPRHDAEGVQSLMGVSASPAGGVHIIRSTAKTKCVSNLVSRHADKVISTHADTINAIKVPRKQVAEGN